MSSVTNKKDDPCIEVKDYSFRYSKDQDWVVKDLNFKIDSGDFVGVIGPSGSGKSTLCLTFNGIIPHMIDGESDGEILVHGNDIDEREVYELAQKVGIILQDPESQLFSMTVEDEVTFGPEELGLPPEEIKERSEWALEATGLKGMENKFPEDLSGGEKQRLAIAASLSMKPDILVLDEPTSQIDPKGTKDVLSVIKKLNDQGITIILIEHETNYLSRYSNKILAINEGNLEFFGSTRDFFEREKLVKDLNIRIPTYVEISYLLNSEVCLTREEIIEVLEKERSCVD